MINVYLRTVVAIPVCNEAERIAACISALSIQDGIHPSRIGIVLFLNNCTDDTAAVVARARATCPMTIRAIERDMAGATAGWARREAMEAAAAWLDEAGAGDGVILTTDADSRVPTDWVLRNLAAIDAGADAVAGRIALDPDEAARLPDALHARGRLEGEYEVLLVELEAAIDPRTEDPWPRHWTASGATIAVRLATYRRVGGLPAVPVGEDRAFVARLLDEDARVRHAPDIVVVTSGRLDGRAPGGAADTMKLRCETPDSPCDPRLEALPRALLRYLWRHRLRQLHAGGGLAPGGVWARLLGISPGDADAISRTETTGRMLSAVEAASPRLAYRALQPRDLPSNIRQARAVLGAVRLAKRLSAGSRAGCRTFVAFGRLASQRLVTDTPSRRTAVRQGAETVGPDTSC